MLAALRTDAEARLRDGVWTTRCLHCRSRLDFDASGLPLGGATLEHVVPRSWFGRRAAAGLTTRVSNADDPRNLALACPRCNHDKGVGPDARGAADERARAVVAMLLDKRLARWREPEGA